MLIYVSCETPEQITNYLYLNKLPTTCINRWTNYQLLV